MYTFTVLFSMYQCFSIYNPTEFMSVTPTSHTQIIMVVIKTVFIQNINIL